MAHLSQDPTLLAAFANGEDIHSSTAAEVFDTTADRVTAQQRRSAKAINFGLIYGMSAFGLGKQLHIGRNEAQGYIDRYFQRYPGVFEYMEQVRASAAERGFVETVFGRRLYLPEINARNAMRRQASERTAINAPMQGTAADIIKLAMISVDRWIFADQLQCRMTMQVHDELVLEVPDNEVDLVVLGLKQRMEGAAELRVPLVVDVGVGNNWNEAH
jgi:DNA polymerase-1